MLRAIFAVVDGGQIPWANNRNLYMKNKYYEGYTRSVEVTNLFVFNVFGEIIHARIKFPGSWNDNKLASM